MSTLAEQQGARVNDLNNGIVQQGVQEKYLQKAVVTLPSGVVQNFFVHKKSKGNVLTDLVSEHEGLLEKDYFGLNYVDEFGERTWLYPDKRIAKQLKKAQWEFVLRVKFYAPEPSVLADDLTRYLLYLQVRKDVYDEKLPTSYATKILLAAIVMQAETGDFESTEQSPEEYDQFVRNARLVPSVDQEFLAKLREAHKEQKGLTTQEAHLKYLEAAKGLVKYGYTFFQGKDVKNGNVIIGVHAHGITIYKDSVQIHKFLWQAIEKIQFSSNKFTILLKPGELDDKKQVTVRYSMPDYYTAKRLYRTAVEHHTFFRLIKPEDKPKSGLLSRVGSEHFRYQGRTYFQAKMASQMFDNPTTTVQRTPSGRQVSRSVDDLAVQRSFPTSPLHYADETTHQATSPEKSKSYSLSSKNKDERTPLSVVVHETNEASPGSKRSSTQSSASLVSPFSGEYIVSSRPYTPRNDSTTSPYEDVAYSLAISPTERQRNYRTPTKSVTSSQRNSRVRFFDGPVTPDDGSAVAMAPAGKPGKRSAKRRLFGPVNDDHTAFSPVNDLYRAPEVVNVPLDSKVSVYDRGWYTATLPSTSRQSVPFFVCCKPTKAVRREYNILPEIDDNYVDQSNLRKRYELDSYPLRYYSSVYHSGLPPTKRRKGVISKDEDVILADRLNPDYYVFNLERDHSPERFEKEADVETIPLRHVSRVYWHGGLSRPKTRVVEVKTAPEVVTTRVATEERTIPSTSTSVVERSFVEGDEPVHEIKTTTIERSDEPGFERTVTTTRIETTTILHSETEPSTSEAVSVAPPQQIVKEHTFVGGYPVVSEPFTGTVDVVSRSNELDLVPIKRYSNLYHPGISVEHVTPISWIRKQKTNLLDRRREGERSIVSETSVIESTPKTTHHEKIVARKRLYSLSQHYPVIGEVYDGKVETISPMLEAESANLFDCVSFSTDEVDLSSDSVSAKKRRGTSKYSLPRCICGWCGPQRRHLIEDQYPCDAEPYTGPVHDIEPEPQASQAALELCVEFAAKEPTPVKEEIVDHVQVVQQIPTINIQEEPFVYESEPEEIQPSIGNDLQYDMNIDIHKPNDFGHVECVIQTSVPKQSVTCGLTETTRVSQSINVNENLQHFEKVETNLQDVNFENIEPVKSEIVSHEHVEKSDEPSPIHVINYELSRIDSRRVKFVPEASVLRSPSNELITEEVSRPVHTSPLQEKRITPDEGCGLNCGANKKALEDVPYGTDKIINKKSLRSLSKNYPIIGVVFEGEHVDLSRHHEAKFVDLFDAVSFASGSEDSGIGGDAVRAKPKKSALKCLWCGPSKSQRKSSKELSEVVNVHDEQIQRRQVVAKTETFPLSEHYPVAEEVFSGEVSTLNKSELAPEANLFDLIDFVPSNDKVNVKSDSDKVRGRFSCVPCVGKSSGQENERRLSHHESIVKAKTVHSLSKNYPVIGEVFEGDHVELNRYPEAKFVDLFDVISFASTSEDSGTGGDAVQAKLKKSALKCLWCGPSKSQRKSSQASQQIFNVHEQQIQRNQGVRKSRTYSVSDHYPALQVPFEGELVETSKTEEIVTVNLFDAVSFTGSTEEEKVAQPSLPKKSAKCGFLCAPCLGRHAELPKADEKHVDVEVNEYLPVVRDVEHVQPVEIQKELSIEAPVENLSEKVSLEVSQTDLPSIVQHEITVELPINVEEVVQKVETITVQRPRETSVSLDYPIVTEPFTGSLDNLQKDVEVPGANLFDHVDFVEPTVEVVDDVVPSTSHEIVAVRTPTPPAERDVTAKKGCNLLCGARNKGVNEEPYIGTRKLSHHESIVKAKRAYSLSKNYPVIGEVFDGDHVELNRYPEAKFVDLFDAISFASTSEDSGIGGDDIRAKPKKSALKCLWCGPSKSQRKSSEELSEIVNVHDEQIQRRQVVAKTETFPLSEHYPVAEEVFSGEVSTLNKSELAPEANLFDLIDFVPSNNKVNDSDKVRGGFSCVPCVRKSSGQENERRLSHHESIVKAKKVHSLSKNYPIIGEVFEGEHVDLSRYQEAKFVDLFDVISFASTSDDSGIGGDAVQAKPKKSALKCLWCGPSKSQRKSSQASQQIVNVHEQQIQRNQGVRKSRTYSVSDHYPALQVPFEGELVETSKAEEIVTVNLFDAVSFTGSTEEEKVAQPSLPKKSAKCGFLCAPCLGRHAELPKADEKHVDVEVNEYLPVVRDVEHVQPVEIQKELSIEAPVEEPVKVSTEEQTVENLSEKVSLEVSQTDLPSIVQREITVELPINVEEVVQKVETITVQRPREPSVNLDYPIVTEPFTGSLDNLQKDVEVPGANLFDHVDFVEPTVEVVDDVVPSTSHEIVAVRTPTPPAERDVTAKKGCNLLCGARNKGVNEEPYIGTRKLSHHESIVKAKRAYSLSKNYPVIGEVFDGDYVELNRYPEAKFVDLFDAISFESTSEDSGIGGDNASVRKSEKNGIRCLWCGPGKSQRKVSQDSIVVNVVHKQQIERHQKVRKADVYSLSGCYPVVEDVFTGDIANLSKAELAPEANLFDLIEFADTNIGKIGLQTSEPNQRNLTFLLCSLSKTRQKSHSLSVSSVNAESTALQQRGVAHDSTGVANRNSGFNNKCLPLACMSQDKRKQQYPKDDEPYVGHVYELVRPDEAPSANLFDTVSFADDNDDLVNLRIQSNGDLHRVSVEHIEVHQIAPAVEHVEVVQHVEAAAPNVVKKSFSKSNEHPVFVHKVQLDETVISSENPVVSEPFTGSLDNLQKDVEVPGANLFDHVAFVEPTVEVVDDVVPSTSHEIVAVRTPTPPAERDVTAKKGCNLWCGARNKGVNEEPYIGTRKLSHHESIVKAKRAYSLSKNYPVIGEVFDGDHVELNRYPEAKFVDLFDAISFASTSEDSGIGGDAVRAKPKKSALKCLWCGPSKSQQKSSKELSEVVNVHDEQIQRRQVVAKTETFPLSEHYPVAEEVFSGEVSTLNKSELAPEANLFDLIDFVPSNDKVNDSDKVRGRFSCVPCVGKSSGQENERRLSHHESIVKAKKVHSLSKNYPVIGEVFEGEHVDLSRHQEAKFVDLFDAISFVSTSEDSGIGGDAVQAKPKKSALKCLWCGPSKSQRKSSQASQQFVNVHEQQIQRNQGVRKSRTYSVSDHYPALQVPFEGDLVETSKAEEITTVNLFDAVSFTGSTEEEKIAQPSLPKKSPKCGFLCAPCLGRHAELPKADEEHVDVEVNEYLPVVRDVEHVQPVEIQKELSIEAPVEEPVKVSTEEQPVENLSEKVSLEVSQTELPSIVQHEITVELPIDVEEVVQKVETIIVQRPREPSVSLDYPTVTEPFTGSLDSLQKDVEVPGANLFDHVAFVEPTVEVVDDVVPSTSHEIVAVRTPTPPAERDVTAKKGCNLWCGARNKGVNEEPYIGTRKLSHHESIVKAKRAYSLSKNYPVIGEVFDGDHVELNRYPEAKFVDLFDAISFASTSEDSGIGGDAVQAKPKKSALKCLWCGPSKSQRKSSQVVNVHDEQIQRRQVVAKTETFPLSEHYPVAEEVFSGEVSTLNKSELAPEANLFDLIDFVPSNDKVNVKSDSDKVRGGFSCVPCVRKSSGQQNERRLSHHESIVKAKKVHSLSKNYPVIGEVFEGEHVDLSRHQEAKFVDLFDAVSFASASEDSGIGGDAVQAKPKKSALKCLWCGPSKSQRKSSQASQQIVNVHEQQIQRNQGVRKSRTYSVSDHYPALQVPFEGDLVETSKAEEIATVNLFDAVSFTGSHEDEKIAQPSLPKKSVKCGFLCAPCLGRHAELPKTEEEHVDVEVNEYLPVVRDVDFVQPVEIQKELSIEAPVENLSEKVSIEVSQTDVPSIVQHEITVELPIDVEEVVQKVETITVQRPREPSVSLDYPIVTEPFTGSLDNLQKDVEVPGANLFDHVAFVEPTVEVVDDVVPSTSHEIVAVRTPTPPAERDVTAKKGCNLWCGARNNGVNEEPYIGTRKLSHHESIVKAKRAYSLSKNYPVIGEVFDGDHVELNRYPEAKFVDLFDAISFASTSEDSGIGGDAVQAKPKKSALKCLWCGPSKSQRKSSQASQQIVNVHEQQIQRNQGVRKSRTYSVSDHYPALQVPFEGDLVETSKAEEIATVNLFDAVSFTGSHEDEKVAQPSLPKKSVKCGFLCAPCLGRSAELPKADEKHVDVEVNEYLPVVRDVEHVQLVEIQKELPMELPVEEPVKVSTEEQTVVQKVETITVQRPREPSVSLDYPTVTEPFTGSLDSLQKDVEVPGANLFDHVAFVEPTVEVVDDVVPSTSHEIVAVRTPTPPAERDVTAKKGCNLWCGARNKGVNEEPYIGTRKLSHHESIVKAKRAYSLSKNYPVIGEVFDGDHVELNRYPEAKFVDLFDAISFASTSEDSGIGGDAVQAKPKKSALKCLWCGPSKSQRKSSQVVNVHDEQIQRRQVVAKTETFPLSEHYPVAEEVFSGEVSTLNKSELAPEANLFDLIDFVPSNDKVNDSDKVRGRFSCVPCVGKSSGQENERRLSHHESIVKAKTVHSLSKNYPVIGEVFEGDHVELNRYPEAKFVDLFDVISFASTSEDSGTGGDAVQAKPKKSALKCLWCGPSKSQQKSSKELSEVVNVHDEQIQRRQVVAKTETFPLSEHYPVAEEVFSGEVSTLNKSELAPEANLFDLIDFVPSNDKVNDSDNVRGGFSCVPCVGKSSGQQNERRLSHHESIVKAKKVHSLSKNYPVIGEVFEGDHVELNRYPEAKFVDLFDVISFASTSEDSGTGGDAVQAKLKKSALKCLWCGPSKSQRKSSKDLSEVVNVHDEQIQRRQITTKAETFSLSEHYPVVEDVYAGDVASLSKTKPASEANLFELVEFAAADNEKTPKHEVRSRSTFRCIPCVGKTPLNAVDSSATVTPHTHLVGYPKVSAPFTGEVHVLTPNNEVTAANLFDCVEFAPADTVIVHSGKDILKSKTSTLEKDVGTVRRLRLFTKARGKLEASSDFSSYPEYFAYDGPLNDVQKLDDLHAIPLRQHVTVYHSGRPTVASKFGRERYPGEEEISEPASTYDVCEITESNTVPLHPFYSLDVLPLVEHAKRPILSQSEVVPSVTLKRKYFKTRNAPNIDDDSSSQSSEEQSKSSFERKRAKSEGFFTFFRNKIGSRTQKKTGFEGLMTPDVSDLRSTTLNNELPNYSIHDHVHVYHHGASTQQPIDSGFEDGPNASESDVKRGGTLTWRQSGRFFDKFKRAGKNSSVDEPEKAEPLVEIKTAPATTHYEHLDQSPYLGLYSTTERYVDPDQVQLASAVDQIPVGHYPGHAPVSLEFVLPKEKIVTTEQQRQPSVSKSTKTTLIKRFSKESRPDYDIHQNYGLSTAKFEGEHNIVNKDEDTDERPIGEYVTVYHCGKSDVPTVPVPAEFFEVSPERTISTQYPNSTPTSEFESIAELSITLERNPKSAFRQVVLSDSDKIEAEATSYSIDENASKDAITSMPQADELSAEPLREPMIVYHSGRSSSRDASERIALVDDTSADRERRDLIHRLRAFFRQHPKILEGYPEIGDVCKYDGPLAETTRSDDLDQHDLRTLANVYHSGFSNDTASKKARKNAEKRRRRALKRLKVNLNDYPHDDEPVDDAHVFNLYAIRDIPQLPAPSTLPAETFYSRRSHPRHRFLRRLRQSIRRQRRASAAAITLPDAPSRRDNFTEGTFSMVVSDKSLFTRGHWPVTDIDVDVVLSKHSRIDCEFETTVATKRAYESAIAGGTALSRTNHSLEASPSSSANWCRVRQYPDGSWFAEVSATLSVTPQPKPNAEKAEPTDVASIEDARGAPILNEDFSDDNVSFVQLIDYTDDVTCDSKLGFRESSDCGHSLTFGDTLTRLSLTSVHDDDDSTMFTAITRRLSEKLTKKNKKEEEKQRKKAEKEAAKRVKKEKKAASAAQKKQTGGGDADSVSSSSSSSDTDAEHEERHIVVSQAVAGPIEPLIRNQELGDLHGIPENRRVVVMAPQSAAVNHVDANSAGPYTPAKDKDGRVIREETVEQVYRISGSGKVPKFDPTDMSLQAAVDKCVRETDKVPRVQMVEANILVKENEPLPQALREGSAPHTTVHTWHETEAGPETVTTEVDKYGNKVTRTVKTQHTKHTIQKQSYQTYAVEGDSVPEQQTVIETTNEVSPLGANAVVRSPVVHTKTRTVAYEKGSQNEPTEPIGDLVSSKTITTGNRTVEILTYKTEKDGVIETRVEHRVTIHSGSDIDHDAELAKALLEATEMSPDLLINRVEVEKSTQG